MILFNLSMADNLQICINFCKYPQGRNVRFSSLPSKVKNLKEKIISYLESPEQAFEKSVYVKHSDNYLDISNDQRQDSTRTRNKAESNEKTNKELKTDSWINTTTPFVTDLLAEIDEAFSTASDEILNSIEVFNPSNLSKNLTDLKNHFEPHVNVLGNFYSNDKTDTFRERSTTVEKIINSQSLNDELDGFLETSKDIFESHKKELQTKTVAYKKIFCKEKTSANVVEEKLKSFIAVNEFIIDDWFKTLSMVKLFTPT